MTYNKKNKIKKEKTLRIKRLYDYTKISLNVKNC